MFVIDFFMFFFFSVLFLLASLFILFSWFFTFGQVKSNTGYGRSRQQSFRVCKVNLPTLKVAMQLKMTQNMRNKKRPSRFASTCGGGTAPVLLHLPCHSARLPRRPSGSSGALPRDPSLLGISFESAAHYCPDRRNMFLGFLLVSRFLTCCRLLSTLAFLFSPDFLLFTTWCRSLH